MIRINNRKSKNKQRNKQTRAHRKHRKHSKHSKHNKDNKHNKNNKNNMVQIGGGNSPFLQVKYPDIEIPVLNGVDYNWIDSDSIINIANYIEGKLDDKDKVL